MLTEKKVSENISFRWESRARMFANGFPNYCYTTVAFIVLEINDRADEYPHSEVSIFNAFHCYLKLFGENHSRTFLFEVFLYFSPDRLLACPQDLSKKARSRFSSLPLNDQFQP